MTATVCGTPTNGDEGPTRTTPIPTVTACATASRHGSGPTPTVADRTHGSTEDSDADGLRDVEEAALGTDPTQPDTDGDSRLDGEETVQSGGDPKGWSDPTVIDSDHDGVNDRWDDRPNTPDAPGSIPDFLRDTDEDGVNDSAEGEYGTDPRNADTDGDGFSDRVDVAPRRPNRSNDPSGDGDYDGDGVSNADEKTFGSDPFNPDSVGQGRGDRAEVDVAVRERAEYQAETSGPIGYLATLQTHGTTPTEAEVEAARASIEELIGSENIMARDRGYEARRDFDGIEPPGAHVAAMEEFVRDARDADVDRDPAAFARAFEAQTGRPPSAGEVDAFRNPSPSDVIGAGRVGDLLGRDLPADSALSSQIDAVLQGNQPGAAAPTSTGPNRPGATPGTGSSPGSGSTPNTGTSPSAGTEPPVDQSDRPIGTNAGGNGPGAQPTTPTAPTSPGAGTTPTAGPDTGGAPAPPTTEPSAPDGGGAFSTDSQGNTNVVRPDGSGTQWGPDGEVTYDSRAERAAVAAGDSSSNWRAYLDTPPMDKPAGGDPDGADPDADEEDPDEEEDEGDEPDGEEGEDAEDDEEDEDDAEDDEDDNDDNDDQDEEEEGMTDPDAGGGSAPGIDAGSGSINPQEFISSTRGAAVTNTGRGDLGGGLGPVTGEVRTTNTAGPDVNPDADSMEGGGSLRAPAPEDGVNPDLVHGLGPLQPPTDDGVNPYAGRTGVPRPPPKGPR